MAKIEYKKSVSFFAVATSGFLSYGNCITKVAKLFFGLKLILSSDIPSKIWFPTVLATRYDMYVFELKFFFLTCSLPAKVIFYIFVLSVKNLFKCLPCDIQY